MSTQQGEEIIVRAEGGQNIPPHPAGQFAARCIDIIDHGMVKTTWNGREKVQHRGQLRFWCGEYAEGDEGPIPLYLDKFVTMSLHEKANLRKFLEQWRGQPFTDEELHGFNLATLLGANAFVQVVHNPTPNKTYANISTVMKLPRGMKPVEPLQGYIRVKDRPPREDVATSAANGRQAGRHAQEPWPTEPSGPWEDPDDSLPF